jgi:hypothetical protein
MVIGSVQLVPSSMANSFNPFSFSRFCGAVRNATAIINSAVAGCSHLRCGYHHGDLSEFDAAGTTFSLALKNQFRLAMIGEPQPALGGMVCGVKSQNFVPLTYGHPSGDQFSASPIV